MRLITSRFFLSFLLVGIMAGCATDHGNTAIRDKNKVDAIQIGKSTKKDVTAQLGRPTNVSLESGGEEIWLYYSARTSGKVFIPFVGMASNNLVTSDNLTLRFNKAGVLTAKGSGASSY